MIYLRHAYRRSGLPEPATVHLHLPPVRWLEVQAASEFERLFPSSRVSAGGDPPPADLHVLVRCRDTRAGPDPAGWARRHAPLASLALAVYCVDPRRLEVVPAGEVRSWARRHRLLAAATRARLRHPRGWSRLAALYAACAS